MAESLDLKIEQGDDIPAPGKGASWVTWIEQAQTRQNANWSPDQYETAAEKILKHHRVPGLLKLNILDENTERYIRAYDDRPVRTETEHTLTLLTEIDD